MSRGSAPHRAARRRTRDRPRRTEQQTGRLQDDVGDFIGMMLEDRSRERAFASFSPLVRRTHVIFGDALVALLEGAAMWGVFSEE